MTYQGTQQPSSVCLHKIIRNGLSNALGPNGCSDSYLAYNPWILMFLLLVTLHTRYRRFAFHYIYKNRAAPTSFTYLTQIPWEALAALAIALPRFYWATTTTKDAILNNEAWEHANFAQWPCWGLVLFVFLGDLFEQRAIKKKLLTPYWAKKRLDTELVDVKTILLEGRQTVPQNPQQHDPEKGPLIGNLPERDNKGVPFRQRLAMVFTLNFGQVTALNIAVHYQLFAFTKVMFAFVFASEIGLSACELTGDWAPYVLDSHYSIAPAMIFASAMYLWRFVTFTIAGWRFSSEVDWENADDQ